MKHPVMFLLLPAMLLFCNSCVQNVSNKEMIGTGAGGAVGALIGQAVGRNTAGTLIGATIGAGLGYLIASELEKSSRMVHNDQATRDRISHTGNNGQVLQIQESRIQPSSVIKRGDKVTVAVQYVVMNDVDSGCTVKETKSIWHDGVQESVLDESLVQRENGTWESTISFELPENAQPGEYEIRQVIATNEQTRVSAVPFTVI